MKRDKKIVIPGWMVGDNSFGVTKAYLEYFSRYGKVHILHPSNEIVEDADLLVLPGGKDVLTTRYGQIPSMHTGQPDMILEWFDHTLLPKYIDMGIPIFATCRGMQTLNVFFGGSLKQHLYGHPYSTEWRGERVHEVYTPEDYARFKASTKKSSVKPHMKVNSLHHQAIDKLGEGLIPLLISNDGIIEAIKHETLPIYGQQFHIEEMLIRDKLLEDLLKINEE